MKELILMIRPEKLEKVKQIMDDAGCGGMTISSAMGCGSQRGIVKEFGEGSETQTDGKTMINLLPKIMVQIVVREAIVEQLITEIREQISTGHVGDGKLFVRDIEDSVRIRTGERGEEAL